MKDLTQLMFQMLKQQQEDRQMMIRILEAQTEGTHENLTVRSNRSNSISSLDSFGADCKSIVDKIEWIFSDVERKLNNLNDDIDNSLGSLVYKDSLKAIQKAEEKLENFLEEKKCYLNEQQATKLKKRFEDIACRIQEKKVVTIKLCKQEEDEKRAGYLPTGISPPDFFGDPNQFPVWWESFDAVVNSNDKVSTFYKYRYLRQCLKGQASHCLDGFSPLSDHYSSALEHVKSHFGQPRKVVRHIMKSIVDMPTLTTNDCRVLRKSYDMIQGKLHSLCNYANKIENPIDAIVIPILESKLTNELKESWERELLKTCNDDEFATVGKYSEWFSREVRSRETVETKREPKKVNDSKNYHGNFVPFSSQALPVNTDQKHKKTDRENLSNFCKKCCRQNHTLKDCYRFRKDSVKQRWNFAKENHLCFQCLQDFHPGKPCDNSESCSVEGCTRRHHALLHFVPSQNSSETVQSLFSGIKPSKFSHDSSTRDIDKIMPSAVVTLHASNGNSKHVRVAFDTMCQDSFIKEDLVKELGMKYEKNLHMDVNGLGEKISSMRTGRVTFDLSKCNDSSKIFSVDALVRPGRICSPLEPVEIDWSRCSHLSSLEIADELPHNDCEVDVLVGLNHYLKLVSGTLIRHPSDDEVPAAMETVFGYGLIGKNQKPLNLKPESSFKEKIGCMFIQVREKTELEKTVEKFWDLESIGIVDGKKLMTFDERDAMEQFEKSIKFENGRYCVNLPFRSNAPKLESNFESAKRQMFSTETRLKRNESMKENYEKAMQDYEDMGFARKATKEEIDDFSKGQEYFIPHHAVVREESVTTKTRIVFNASSPDKNGNSLNDCLLSGPVLQPDLNQILLRFRTRKFALMADIAKMFCQTKIDPSNYRYQQYLWRHFHELSEPVQYIMVRLMFGIKPSPFLAIASVNHHMKTEAMMERYPLGCAAAKDIGPVEVSSLSIERALSKFTFASKSLS